MATTINSGYGNSPKLTANIADHADVYGGRALVFDGVSDYLDCGDLTFLNSASAFSMSVWIKSDNTNSLDYLYNKASSGSNRIHISIAYNIIYFNVTNGSASYGTVAFTSTDWNHISLVFNGSGTGNSNRLKAYINGEEQSLTYTGTIPSATGNLSGTAFQIGKYLTDHFEGSMCDFKIFNSALTEAQVQELYKKPENTPSAVQDNLVAWYPMIEGNPESPQSIVYDHSEKKLGSEIITNGDYSNGTTGWSIGAGGTADTSSGALVYTYSGSGNNFVKQEGITAVNGALYKAVFTVTESGGSAYYGYWDGTNLSSSVINLDTGQKTYTQYFTATSTSITIRFVSGYTNGNSITVDNVSVKEVLMGNHATTNFFGDDLTNGHGAFDVTTNWSVVGGSLGTEWSIGSSKATHATGNTRSLRYENLSNPTISGREYQVDFTISGRTAGNLDFAVGSGPASASDFTASGSVILTSGGSASRIVDIITSSDFDGSVELITVKEVGISSSGFETAVNEPVVPQVPLMRYNQKAIFYRNKNNYVSLTEQTLGANTAFTISFSFTPFRQGEHHMIGKNSLDDTIRIDTAPAYGSRVHVRISGTGLTHFTGLGNININEPAFYTITRTTGGVFSVYRNGVKSLISNTSTADFKYQYLGQSLNGAWESDGLLDEFSIFNTHFSDSQVQELFNDGVALDATTHSKKGNLLGYWRNDGVTTWQDRRGWSYLDFNGSADRVQVPNNSAFNFGNGSFSISFWAKNDVISSDNILSKVDSAYKGYHILKHSNTQWFFRANTSSNDCYIYGDNTSPSTGVWTHVVCVADKSVSGNKGLKIYVNSVDSNNATGGGNFEDVGNIDVSNDLYFGILNNGVSNSSAWDGSISSIAMYNKALSQSEIDSIYSGGIAGDESIYSDIVGYWKFNNTTTIVDLINGNNGTVTGTTLNDGNDGTVQGTPDSITIREGLNSNRDGLGFNFTNLSSNVLRLNGVNEYVSVPHTKSLVVSEQLTLECWAKLDRVTPSEDNSMISKYDEAGDTGREYLFQFATDKRITFRVSSAGSSATLRTLRADSAISDGNLWHHYVATFASGTMKMYVDGSEISATASGATVTSIKQNGTANVVVGCISTSSTPRRFFGGLIDEAKVYNRALSASEISKNYKHQKGKHKND